MPTRPFWKGWNRGTKTTHKQPKVKKLPKEPKIKNRPNGR